MPPLRIFTGYDPRESEGWHVFVQSLIETSNRFALMPPLSGVQADGTTAFTYRRFSVPEECNWGGVALFVDAVDMLLRADISGIERLYDPRYAVQVVKHSYKTRHLRKFVGTAMEADNRDYPMKNASSVILWNCGHISHFNRRQEIRDAIERGDGKFLHRFGWLKAEEIGELPAVWNWLVDEFGESEDAKLLHWTAGAPFFAHYRNAPMAGAWHAVAKALHSER